ncbi:MAG: hypothetical protein JOZ37_06710 [Actinobacteria bacterium]|nr:hypothetical protein [Actinomycetota bacterium]MBV9255972.1 hypothetical protein [Actinomycetota bacterium]MBV9663639.1 hypothetical protein [Actinomycetota bacterium]
MLSVKAQFIFYLAATICLVIAALAEGGRGRGITGRISLLPLGLALWLFPTMWNTGHAAFK